MRLLWVAACLALPSLLALASGVEHSSHPAGKAVVIRAARMLDVESGAMHRDAVVVVRDGIIRAAGPATEIAVPPDAEVIDLGETTLLPGLIDAHVHLAWGPAQPGADEAAATLRAGFTTVRNLGSTGRADLALRDAIRDGTLSGPRMLAAATPVSFPGGVCDQVFQGEGTANGAAAVAARAREVLDAGADVIKLCAGGGVMPSPADDAAVELSEEEIRTIVLAAHERRKKVAAHAQGPTAILNAVRAGVDSVEHGAGINEEAARLMRQKTVFLVPTLYRLDFALEAAEKRGAPPATLQRLRANRDAARANVRKAIALGVPVALGTDATVIPHGLNAREFGVLVELGLSPLNAVRAGTIWAAELLDLRAQIGSLAAGKSADIVAVKGHPLEDIRALERVRFVMQAGRVVRNDEP